MPNDIEMVGGDLVAVARREDPDMTDAERQLLEDRARMDEARALARQLGYQGEVSLSAVLETVRVYARRTLEDALGLGAALLMARQLTPHGQWGEVLERLGFPERTAQKYMAVAWRAAQNRTGAEIVQRSGSIRKAALLLDFDDAEAEYLLQGGQVRGITMAEIETDSADVLRAKLTKAEARAQAAEAKYAERDEDYLVAVRRADEWRRKAEKILAEREQASAVVRNEELKNLGAQASLITRDFKHDMDALWSVVKKMATVERPEGEGPEMEAYRREMKTAVFSTLHFIENGPAALSELVWWIQDHLQPLCYTPAELQQQEASRKAAEEREERARLGLPITFDPAPLHIVK